MISYVTYAVICWEVTHYRLLNTTIPQNKWLSSCWEGIDRGHFHMKETHVISWYPMYIHIWIWVKVRYPNNYSYEML